MPSQPTNKSGKGKMKNFADLCAVFMDACSDIEDCDGDPVSDLIEQLRASSQNVSGLNESDMTAIKVVNLLLPAVNVISSKIVGKSVREHDEKINKLCSVVRINAYEIDKQNQYSRRENIRISGIQEDEDTDDFDTFKKLCNKMEIEITKEDIVACHRVGNPAKKPRPLLVRLVSRDMKGKIFASKKKLKADPHLNKVYINEDLTAARFKLLQYVKKLDNVKNASSRDGKIFCNMKNGKKFNIENADDLFHLGVHDVDYKELGLPEI